MTTRIDRRLDRLPRFDDESRTYSIRAIAPSRELISKTWLVTKCLDQGREGACVGFGITHGLLAEPRMGSTRTFTAKFAREKIYYEAQKSDPWPGGEYPGAYPIYSGTSVLDGLKQAKKIKKISSYRWAFGIDDMLVGLGYFGPAIVGTNWLEGMTEPGVDGRIRATGWPMGGHCYLVSAFNVHSQLLTIHNSWGLGWGINGTAKISVSDFEKLLQGGGECAFIIK